MLNKTSRLALVLALLATGLLSFLTLRAYEQYAEGMDWDYVLYAKGTAPTLEDDEFARLVTQAAQSSGVTITHLVYNRENYRLGGTLFQVGPATFDSESYPAFARGAEREVRPLEDLGNGSRGGYWFVTGPESSSRHLVRAFDKLGAEPELIRLDRTHQVWSRAVEPPTAGFTWLSVFLVLTLTAAGVLLKARDSAVQEMHGRSFGGALLEDGVAAGRLLAVATVGYLGGAAALMGWYNGLHWFGVFLGTQASFLAALLLLFAVTHATALGLVRLMPILPRVRGELRSRLVHLLMYTARVVAVALAFTYTAAAHTQELLVDSRVESAAVWASTRGNVQLGLRGQETEATQERSQRALGGWVARQDRAGEALLVRRLPLQDLGPPQFIGGRPGTELLIVNSTYLAERPILDSQRRQVDASGDDEVLVLVPEAGGLRRDVIRDQVSDLVDAELHLLRKDAPDTPGHRPVRVVTSAAGQRVFGYLNETSGNQDPFLVDPVVVVLPSSAPVFSDLQWSAWLSMGQVIFRDKERTLESLGRAHLLEAVTFVNEVEVTNAEQARDVVTRAKLYRLNLLAMFAALLATSLGFAVVHTRRHASAIFTQHVHGWHLLRRHWRLLLVDGAILAWLLHSWIDHTTRASYEWGADALPPPPPHWTGALVVALAAGVLWLGLGRLTRTLLRRRAAD